MTSTTPAVPAMPADSTRPAPVRLPLALLGCMLLLTGCGGTPTKEPPATTPDTGGPPDAVPRVEPLSRYGNMDSYVVLGRRYDTKDSSRGFVERGTASWYGAKFHGRKTSSGEVYDMHRMTAAHRTLPLPTYARVTNLENGRSAVVKVNDRGPFAHERVIDLSYAAATKLDVVRTGTARVEIVSIDPRDHEGRVPDLRTATATPSPAPATPRRSARQSTPAVAAHGSDSPPLRSAVYLQVGAFGSRGNAEHLLQRLRAHLAEPVQVSEAARLYKVRVGPLGSAARAASLRHELAALGIASPILVTP